MAADLGYAEQSADAQAAQTMKLVVSQAAAADLARLYEFLADKSPTAAARFRGSYQGRRIPQYFSGAGQAIGDSEHAQRRHAGLVPGIHVFASARQRRHGSPGKVWQ